MSVIEDVRQVLQDFIAPELKSLEARLNALELEVRQGFVRSEASIADAKTEARKAAGDLKTDMRTSFNDIRTEMRTGFTEMKAAIAQLGSQINLAQQVEKFNERLTPVQQPRQH